VGGEWANRRSSIFVTLSHVADALAEDTDNDRPALETSVDNEWLGEFVGDELSVTPALSKGKREAMPLMFGFAFLVRRCVAASEMKSNPRFRLVKS
jgi:hypothetical protein